MLHADQSPLGLAAEHRETEAALKGSGLPWVLLRNGWYTENYAASIPAALQHGVFLGSAGAGRIASAARADYAEAAAAVLLRPDQAGRTYELAGDSAYTLAEFAGELARQAGKAVAYQDLTAKRIYEAARSGDPIALEAFDRTARTLGLKLADAVAHTGPEAIFLFGGMAAAGDLLLEPAQAYMDACIFPAYRNHVRLLPSRLEAGSSAILGAAALIWNELP